MEKLNVVQKGISYVLDTRKISSQKTGFKLIATEEDCRALADWYEIPAVLSVETDICTFLTDKIITLQGQMRISTRRECIITGEEFTQNANENFTLLFSTSPVPTQTNPDINLDEEPIEYLPRGQIYFKDIIFEQFGLMLDPFPKNTNKPFVYYEETTQVSKENPFSILKHLTKG